MYYYLHCGRMYWSYAMCKIWENKCIYRSTKTYGLRHIALYNTVYYYRTTRKILCNIIIVYTHKDTSYSVTCQNVISVRCLRTYRSDEKYCIHYGNLNSFSRLNKRSTGSIRRLVGHWVRYRKIKFFLNSRISSLGI